MKKGMELLGSKYTEMYLHTSRTRSTTSSYLPLTSHVDRMQSMQDSCTLANDVKSICCTKNVAPAANQTAFEAAIPDRCFSQRHISLPTSFPIPRILFPSITFRGSGARSLFSFSYLISLPPSLSLTSFAFSRVRSRDNDHR